MPRKMIERETNFMDAAMVWYDIDLLRSFQGTSLGESREAPEKEVIYILSRMWLAQLMAEYNVEDYNATITFLLSERAKG